METLMYAASLPGAVGGGISLVHCPAAEGQWVVTLLRCIAKPLGAHLASLTSWVLCGSALGALCSCGPYATSHGDHFKVMAPVRGHPGASLKYWYLCGITAGPL